MTGKLVNCMERMMALYLDVEKEKPLLIIGKLFPQNEETLGFPVVYFDDTDDAVGVLASHMRKGGTIGIDKTWPASFPASPHGAWRGRQVMINASYIIDHIRQVKTPEEQEKMRAASLVNDQSMGELIPLTASGMNEVELGEELRKIYVKNGAVGHSFEPIVGFGDERSGSAS
ncbi:MAG: M24 family metallopeptidase [Lachnospiraceae bacterium]